MVAHDGRMGARRWLVASSVALLSATVAGPASATKSTVEQEVTRSLKQLSALHVTTSPPAARYQRDYFGAAWADVDGNHCRTRDDILARDLTRISRRGACTVMSGTLADPYTGRREAFSKTRATAIQIDHLVPLSLAWRSGASTWPAGKLGTFANDPLNLLAVDGAVNEAKGDSGPSAWLPPYGRYRCTYVMRFVRVAFLYGVTIANADRVAVKRVLRSCAVVYGHPTKLLALSPGLWSRAASFVHAAP